MTTPTHSHKAWTDKGGHVTLELPPIRQAIASNSIRLIDNQNTLTLHKTEVMPKSSGHAGRLVSPESLGNQNWRPHIFHALVRNAYKKHMTNRAYKP